MPIVGKRWKRGEHAARGGLSPSRPLSNWKEDTEKKKKGSRGKKEAECEGEPFAARPCAFNIHKARKGGRITRKKRKGGEGPYFSRKS